jgi:hypothetical protein
MKIQITENIRAVVRRLIADGLDPDEVIEAVRGDMVCLRGKASVFAKTPHSKSDRSQKVAPRPLEAPPSRLNLPTLVRQPPSSKTHQRPP